MIGLGWFLGQVWFAWITSIKPLMVVTHLSRLCFTQFMKVAAIANMAARH
jgi:hypothetical protein